MPTASTKSRQHRARRGRPVAPAVGTVKTVGIDLTAACADGKAVGIGSQGYAYAVGIAMFFSPIFHVI